MHVFSWKEMTSSAFQVENEFTVIGVESIKMWQNIPDTFCFQRTTSGIKGIGFIRSTSNI